MFPFSKPNIEIAQFTTEILYSHKMKANSTIALFFVRESLCKLDVQFSFNLSVRDTLGIALHRFVNAVSEVRVLWELHLLLAVLIGCSVLQDAGQ